MKLKAHEIGILADDLTGACDVASCFADVFGQAVVMVSCEGEKADFSGNFRVINTQSRLMKASECRRLVKSVGLLLENKPVIFKKIDTALRGSLGAELEGLIEAVGHRRVIVAPALPKIGRTTINGIQYIGGVPVGETDHSRDIASPTRSSDISEIIKETGDAKFIVEDAQSDDDLEEIVDKYLSGGETVFVGSLGLAEALAKRTERAMAPKPTIRKSKRPIIITASQYERTRTQIGEAVSKYDAKVITVEIEGDRSSVQAIREKPIETNTPLIVRMSSVPSRLRPSELAFRFALKAGDIVEEMDADGIGVIGGETAFHLFRQLAATELLVSERISDVIACGMIVDGKMKGAPFATKGGSVGADDSIVKMIGYMTNPGDEV